MEYLAPTDVMEYQTTIRIDYFSTERTKKWSQPEQSLKENVTFLLLKNFKRWTYPWRLNLFQSFFERGFELKLIRHE